LGDNGSSVLVFSKNKLSNAAGRPGFLRTANGTAMNVRRRCRCGVDLRLMI
jgi:hypothetical protein